jgi:hypothetical protein
MRKAARVLGLVGGTLGIVVGLFALFAYTVVGTLSVLGSSDQGPNHSTMFVQGMVAALLGVCAIVGATLMEKRRVAASIFLLASGVLGFVCLYDLWIPIGAMLVVGGVLIAASRKTDHTEAPQAVE